MIRPIPAVAALCVAASILAIPSIATPSASAAAAASKAPIRPILDARCAKVGATATGSKAVTLRCGAAKRWVVDTLPAVPVTAPPVATTAPPPATFAATTAPSSSIQTANIINGCAANYDSSIDYFPEKESIAEATNLQIRYQHNYKVLTVPQVFKGAKSTTYVLVQCGTPVPKLEGDLAGATVVNVPISSAAIMSTTLAPPFEIVGAPEKIVAVDDPQNYSTPSVVKGLAAGTIKGVGGNSRANVEALVAMKPSVILTYTSGGADGLDAMRQAGLTVVLEGSPLEQTPLGRAEWSKLIGALTNRDKAAQIAFDKLRSDYRALSLKANATPVKPVVISGSMYQGTWYMPGGKSFPAQLIRDAGGAYPFSADSSVGSLPLDLEAVFDKAYDATVWVNAGYLWDSQSAILAEDNRYRNLLSFKLANVWGSDKRVNRTGGSDFFETAVVRPDLVLADLVSVLHPELEPGYETIWYRHIPR